MATNSGIGLETSILFAQNGANVLMADYNEAALKVAHAKAQNLAPDAKIEFIVRSNLLPPFSFCTF